MDLTGIPVEKLRLELKKPEQPKEECKGLVFRCEITSWLGSDLDVNFRERYRFIKSKSCLGCDQCGYLWDDLQERTGFLHELDAINRNGKHGKLYTLRVSNISHDWESGVVDDWDLEFTTITDEE